ncbi:transporter substrate-binding domain-containing protein [Pseudodesulfovibrio thermohalotolerans]|uniref:transglycosylase SLT domain-containing protein n=1 Tax=Pseudodesulfovibrio thermohalotolerans TaxID=2880651 RepID=UPI0024421271|nr:transporter substrate-binding domain-containing protein [Pseudodesulfovibrio thermohalotolerans]WFS62660.1 transporter substrate-binding domain-containing protein [Pseudodesulfovibrio thermohalotolerans]
MLRSNAGAWAEARGPHFADAWRKGVLRFRGAALLGCVICLILAVWSVPARSAEPAGKAGERVRQSWKGDLSQIMETRRPIRVLVVYNRTNFFMKEGVMRGLEADKMRAYEEYLGKSYGKDMVRVVFVPVPFNELFSALREGRGDIAAAALTVTAERKRDVAFAAPYRTGIREIVVGGPGSRELSSAEALSGLKVTVLAGSSYAEHLSDLNALLKKRGSAPVRVREADAHLATEDLLEMVAGGLIPYTVADEFLARQWVKVYPELRLNPDALVHSSGELAWAVRKDCPELRESLSGFAATVRQGTLLGNMLFKRYYGSGEFIGDPTAPVEIGKLKPMADLFRKYAEMYDFDWLKIAALAYRESRFDMSLTSRAGAVGVMQIKPSTAAWSVVGIPDVSTLENNIHAGVKYLRYLTDNYFADAAPEARMDFALAAYNAGPNRITQVRRRAKEMGLDPNRWFGNAEWAAYDLIGRETTAYVAQVLMCYVAYKGAEEVLTKRREAR